MKNVINLAEKTKQQALIKKQEANAWSRKNKAFLVVIITLILITIGMSYLDWWEMFGILLLKFGLGAKVAGAKTFAKAVAKAGGKKAIAGATAGMLLKRHLIDVASKFFAEYSVARYKKNLAAYFGLLWSDIKKLTIMQKFKRFGLSILAIPGMYYFWSKFVGTAVQKFVYWIFVPIVTLIWNIMVSSLTFLTNTLVFILEILFLSSLLDALDKFTWGKKFLGWIDKGIGYIGKLLNWINFLLIKIGIDPKAWLIRLSNKFNKWLENKIDKGLSKIMRIQSRRNRYINGIEKISEKRFIYAQKKCDNKVSFWKNTKKIFSKRFFKKIDWRENRKEKKIKIEKRREKTLHEKRKQKIKSKRENRYTLDLPNKVIRNKRKDNCKK